MELKINLATASLKDAEHAIFLIGAYFGLTQATVGDVRVSVPGQDLTVSGGNTPVVLPPMTPAPVAGAVAQVVQPQENPAAVFGSTPAALPAGAGETPMTADPAAVFAGNAATGPVGGPVIPGAASSAQPAAGPAVGDVGNVAGAVAGPVGSPLPGTQAPAASPTVATSAAGVDLDAAGLPWDNRIHASGEGGAKPKNADGKWRKKRGLNDAALIGKIEAELRATMAAGTAPSNAAQVAAAATPPAPTLPPPPPASGLPVPPQAQAPVGDPSTFEQLMPRITAAVMAGTLPQTALLQAVTAYQLPNIPALAQRPDLVATVWAYLRSMYPALV